MKLRIYALFVFDVVGECKNMWNVKTKNIVMKKWKKYAQLAATFFLYSESPLAIQRPLFPNNPR